MRSADTDPRAERVQLDLLRGSTIARRASLARALTATTIELTRRALREANPAADPDELAVRFVGLCYGRELADGLRRDLESAPPAGTADLTPADPVDALTPVIDTLEQLGVRYHVGGSLASSAYGLPRASADVDLVADLRSDHVDPFVHRLEGEYYVHKDSVLEAIERRGSFNVIHLDTMVKVDVFLPEARPFDQQELSRAQLRTLDVRENARAFFVKSAEDIVLRKLSWYRAGGEVSERQWSDVVGVLKVQAGRLDGGYLTRWATELKIDDLLERALADTKEA